VVHFFVALVASRHRSTGGGSGVAMHDPISDYDYDFDDADLACLVEQADPTGITDGRLLATLKQVFGLNELRDFQQKAIGAALLHRDSLICVSTGYGK
jgi:superfamily II DNA helicase RecQ